MFLDEIAEMPLAIQPKLLQALETGKVRPVGSASEIATDVRIIAATNQPIEKVLQNGLMRSDLYYRLSVIRFDIPPLRERLPDLEQLVDHLLQNAQAKLQRQIQGISAEAMRYRGREEPFPDSPLPPNRASGSPAHGSPVDSFLIGIGSLPHGLHTL